MRYLRYLDEDESPTRATYEMRLAKSRAIGRAQSRAFEMHRATRSSESVLNHADKTNVARLLALPNDDPRRSALLRLLRSKRADRDAALDWLRALPDDEPIITLRHLVGMADIESRDTLRSLLTLFSSELRGAGQPKLRKDGFAIQNRRAARFWAQQRIEEAKHEGQTLGYQEALRQVHEEAAARAGVPPNKGAESLIRLERKDRDSSATIKAQEATKTQEDAATLDQAWGIRKPRGGRAP